MNYKDMCDEMVETGNIKVYLCALRFPAQCAESVGFCNDWSDWKMCNCNGDYHHNTYVCEHQVECDLKVIGRRKIDDK